MSSTSQVPDIAQIRKYSQNLQRLRQEFHDAFAVDPRDARDAASRGTIQRYSSGAENSAVPETHRTVDGPSLEVLKSANYPFLLCEEAPASYAPPPVPFDVEEAVEKMKAKVLVIQTELLAYQETLSSEPRPADGPRISNTEVLQFFSHNPHFAELAWEVSSLQCFYRWVLSHSISALLQVKDQLEYVLMDRRQKPPLSTEEMEECLTAIPFAEAVEVLDNDRQLVIAEERRRLRSVSRTYRDRLPPAAVTAARTCYLSIEEKYMYQEFFNQSEHLLVLFDHTVMLQHAGQKNDVQRSASTAKPASTPSSDASGDAPLARRHLTAESDQLELADVSRDLMEALESEDHIIHTLMETVKERKAQHIQFDLTEEEYQRSRTAQIAVYGCVVSDMSLMAEQMGVAANFLGRYEEWIVYHGFGSHDALMLQLCELCKAPAWPTLPNFSSASHIHRLPSGDVATSLLAPRVGFGASPPTSPLPPPSEENRGASMKNLSTQAKQPVPTAKEAHNAKPPISSEASGMIETPRATQVQGAATENPDQHMTHDVPPSSTFSADYLKSIFLQLLRAAQQHVHDSPEAVAVSSHHGDGDATAVPGDGASVQAVERLWLLLAVRLTVCQFVKDEWSLEELDFTLDQLKGELRGALNAEPQLEVHAESASALVVILQRLVQLLLPSSAVPHVTFDVPVVVHDADVHLDAGAIEPAAVLRRLSPFLSGSELDRWGTLVDALWLQADPSGEANGGLLFGADATQNMAGRVGFLRLASASLGEVQSASHVPSLELHYDLQPWGSMDGSLQSLKAALGVLSDNADAGSSVLTRLAYVRTVLAAFDEVEQHGMLSCYACRERETMIISLSEGIFLHGSGQHQRGSAKSDDLSEASLHPLDLSTAVALLPPPAVQLLRIYKRLHARPQPRGRSPTPFDLYDAPRRFSTVGLLLGEPLEKLAMQRPYLTDLYLMAESLQEDSRWTMLNSGTSTALSPSLAHPVALECATPRERALSIQRESTVNRQSISHNRLVAPLLRCVDDYMTSPHLRRLLRPSEEFSKESPGVGSPRISAFPRQTAMIPPTKDFNASPSPSAVRPGRVA